MSAARGRDGGPSPRGVGRRRAVAGCPWWTVIAAALVLAGCTGTPTPPPTPAPTPEAAPAPSPSGLRIGVVLPPADVTSEEDLDELASDLEELTAERSADVATVRTVVPDGARFSADVAGLLAADGYDLVCVLDPAGARIAQEVADRHPATRFCAVGAARDATAPNVDLLDVAHEELGHAVGTVVTVLADGGAVGLVLGDDAAERTRRAAGLRAALVGADLVLDAVASDVDLDAVADLVGDADPDVLVVDAAGPLGGALLADGPDLSAAPATVGRTDPPVTSLTWQVRPSAIVGAVVDRLVDRGGDDVDALGFADGVFEVTLDAGAPDAARTALDEIVAELAGGGT